MHDYNRLAHVATPQQVTDTTFPDFNISIDSLEDGLFEKAGAHQDFPYSTQASHALGPSVRMTSCSLEHIILCCLRCRELLCVASSWSSPHRCACTACLSTKQGYLLAVLAAPLSLRNVSMSTAALRMQSCRLRVDVLTRREFTTVARSLHYQKHISFKAINICGRLEILEFICWSLFCSLIPLGMLTVFQGLRG
jgi:hypothetical protein